MASHRLALQPYRLGKFFTSGHYLQFMNHLVTKLSKFNALSWPEKRTLLAAMAWLPLFFFGLHILGLRRFQDLLQHDRPSVESALTQDEIVRIATLVNIAARRASIPATCLTRSLLLRWMLQRRGVVSQLRIGVRLNQGTLDAHAWVEFAGVPINDRPDVGVQFAPFAEILPPGAFHSP